MSLPKSKVKAKLRRDQEALEQSLRKKRKKKK